MSDQSDARSCKATRGRKAGRLNVLFITRKWPPAVGGMETYCVELTRRLAERVNLDLHCLPGRKNGAPPSAPALVWFGLTLALRLLTRPVRCDVAHAGDLTLWPLVVLARLRNRNARVVVSVHGTDASYATRRGGRARLYRFYLRLAARFLTDAVLIANSRATAGLMVRLGFAQPKIVPLAATPAVLQDNHAPQSVPHRANADEAPYILFAGRLTRFKGCGWFIENVLQRLDPSFRLKVAGAIVDAVEGRALERPRVDFLGPVDRRTLAALRANATVVVVPNIDEGPASFEGFGLAATEASSEGGVVLTSDLFGLRDAISDGETGFLLPANNAEAWRAKIAEIAAWSPETRGAFIENAATKNASAYSWDRVADETQAAYDGSADQPPLTAKSGREEQKAA